MSEIDPIGAGRELTPPTRPDPGERIQEERREEILRPDVLPRRDDDTNRVASTQAPQAVGERVDVSASQPSSGSGNELQTPQQARELAEDIRERLSDHPELAAQSVRDTAQEPAATRISRAIDALN